MPARIFSDLAVAGTGVVVLSVTYAALRYRGRAGERFSILNHFISELGEWGVSRGAWAFNGGLVAAGLLFMPFVVSLGAALGGALGWVGAFFGAVAALGTSAVGLCPMNNLKRHVPAAIAFFYGGLFMVLVIGVAILTQPPGRAVIPKAASALSLPAALAFSSFVTLPRFLMPEIRRTMTVGRVIQLDPQVIPERPRLWLLPFLEWQVFFTAILWLLGTAFSVSGR